MRFLIALAFVALTMGNAQALKIEKTTVQSSVEVPVWIFTPDDAKGRIPAVLLVQGSGGMNLEHRAFYAKEFAKQGVATVFFDAFSPRGVRETIKRQESVNPFDMAEDARQILLSFKDSPKIDVNRVGILGFSKGGGVVMNLAFQQFNRNQTAPKFAFYIAMYPPCDSVRYNLKTVDRPLEIMIGEKDAYNSPTACKEYASKILEANSPNTVRFNSIPNARHAWDVPGPAYKEETGENYSKCKFVEVAPQVWYDSSHKYKIFDHGKTGERPKALKECMTHTVSWGYDKKAAEKSLSIIKEYVERMKNSPNGFVKSE